jgi:hypothetical protein
MGQKYLFFFQNTPQNPSAFTQIPPEINSGVTMLTFGEETADIHVLMGRLLSFLLPFMKLFVLLQNQYAKSGTCFVK